jgi:recombination protein RecR
VKALPEPVARLATALGRLPGIGPRSAERLALQLVLGDAGRAKELADAIIDAKTRVGACRLCGSLTETQPCTWCSDERRDASVLCIVERPTDALSLEKSGAFKGRYHVLGGKLSPTNGVGPEDLSIGALESRLAAEPVRELILALPGDVEGDATAHYLARRLASHGLRMTRIAQGLPAGGGLEFADELTLGRALEGRRDMS